ncbi:EAL domain-containing protein [Rhizomonospora bruguierae]|uniref:EAL domain-containing protein n=1 Tax=Rhizomonospora bruguierae TaxID=1581705 RepID=UPI001BCBE5A4|nr:EAL domain-containing protein [Micromonospora sp. NBRC 107566]
MPSKRALGVLSPFLGGWYYGGVLAGIAEAAHRAGSTVLAIQTLDAGTDQIEVDIAPEVRHPLAWEHIAGFVVVTNAAGPEYLAAVRESGRPVVLVGHEYPGVGLPAVRADNGTGIRDAVAHLIEHGHRQIAFAGYLRTADVRERHTAYREALAAYGIEPRPALTYEVDNNQVSGGDAAARMMLAAGLPSTAVIAGTDLNAMGLMRTLVAAGRVLPRDQAVVGFDDLRAASFAMPRLTSVRQPVDRLGAAAVATLTRLLAGDPPDPGRIEVPTALVVRESCGCPMPDGEARAVLAAAPVNPRHPATPHRPTTPREPGGGGTTLPPAAEVVRTELELLFQHNGRPESLVEMAHLVHQAGREATLVPGRDADSVQQIGDSIQSAILTLMQTQGRAQHEDAMYLQATLSTQFEVSMDLLRSHEQDPQRLSWLARTSAWAGCLGLWADGRAGADPKAALNPVGLYLRERPGAATEPSARIPVAKFPPRDLVDAAGSRPGRVVFVVPVKVNTSDWGLLAVVDSVDTRVANGRETINQWAALVAVALDHQGVLGALRMQEERLRMAALYDHLTGLPNRAMFLDRLRQAIARAKRRPDRHFGVLFLDLDGFKVVNDSLGHSAGDRLLIQVAERIKSGLRESDVAARFGGDEFLLLLDGVEDLGRPNEVAARLHAALAEPFHLEGQDVVVTASIGIALSSARYSEAEDLLRDADIAMYEAKSQRKGSHAIFDVAMHTRAVNRLQLETELRQAVERGEFEAHFQPIVSLRTGRTMAFEALIRWRHPTRDLVGPDDFLPVAEETGLILPISRWILTESCRRIAAWQASGGRPDLRVSVNVSNRQFWHGTLLDDIREALERTGLDPGCLALEITEGVIMDNVDQARKLLEDLHALGCQVHIDDFGTGYSSLEALHRLPIDALKVDRSFVSRLGLDTRSGELVRTIVLMGRNLGIDLIAEGIETSDHRDRLLQLGCPLGQGYAFSRPVPATQAERLLSRLSFRV